MNPALRYLLTRSFVNGVKLRLQRLRRPKYIAAAILGGAYFYFYFYKFLGQNLGSRGIPFPPEVTTGLWALILFAAALILSWILPASRAAIAFTEAEIAFLFPAPIRRRALIIHKLLRSQFAMLLLAALMTLITGRFKQGPQAWFAMGTLWVVFNTLSMHRIGASFALQRLRERGLADGKRRLAFVLAVAALAVGVEYTRRSITMPELLPNGLPNAAALIDQLVNHGPLRVILIPFKLMVAPFVAPDLASFAFAMLPALGIMAGHFVWVIAADTAFEEAAIVSAQKRAAFIASAEKGEIRLGSRSKKARTPIWRLRPRGFAPTAFVWKSFLKMGGRRTLALWAVLFTTIAVAAWVIRQRTGLGTEKGYVIAGIIVGIICYLAVLLSLVMVGQNASGQLRHGMTMMDLLKTYPIPGWQLALGEIIGPIIAGTAMQWCALGIGGYLAMGLTRSSAGVTGLTLAICLVGIILPVFNTCMSILPSAAALVFPGWFKPQQATAPGLEQTGLRLIIGIGQLLVMAVALIPPVFFGACAWFGTAVLGSSLPIQATAATASATFVFALEAALGIAWLGTLYDRYDGSSE